MGTIYYVCEACAETYPEGACYERSNLRVMPDGRWVCFNCYDNHPKDFAPENDEGAEFTFPRWQDFMEVPEHVPGN